MTTRLHRFCLAILGMALILAIDSENWLGVVLALVLILGFMTDKETL